MPPKIASKYDPQEYGKSNQFQYQDPQRAQYDAKLSGARSTATDNKSSFYNINRVDPNMVISGGQQGSYNPSTYSGYSYDMANPRNQAGTMDPRQSLNQGMQVQKNFLDKGYSKYDPNLTVDKYNADLQNKNLNFLTNNSTNLVGDNMSLSQEEIDRFRNPVTSLGSEAKGYTDKNKTAYEGVQSSFEGGITPFNTQNEKNTMNNIVSRQNQINANTDYQGKVNRANTWRSKADQMYQQGHWDEYVGGLPDEYGRVGDNFREVADAKINQAGSVYAPIAQAADTAQQEMQNYNNSTNVYNPTTQAIDTKFEEPSLMTENPYDSYNKKVTGKNDRRSVYGEDLNKVRIQ